MSLSRTERVIEVLVKAFSKLPKRDRDRLAFHRQQGTKILCGKAAVLYVWRGAG